MSVAKCIQCGRTRFYCKCTGVRCQTCEEPALKTDKFNVYVCNNPDCVKYKKNISVPFKGMMFNNIKMWKVLFTNKGATHTKYHAK